MRILGAVRQSKRKDQSESPETQKRDITAWAELNGHEIIGWAVDVGVSADVHPYDRPDLGQWLTEPEKLAQWDLIAFWKIDRAVRNMQHWYGDLVPEIRNKLGKEVAAVTEGINTATSSNIEIGLRVMIAQEELEKIKSRAKASRAALRRAAKWHGGVAPFGHYAVRTSEGMKLTLDEDAVDVLTTIREKLLDGVSPNAVATWLNAEDVMTARDRHAVRMGRAARGVLWNRTSLISMLQSRHHLGQWTRNVNPKADKTTKKSERQYEVIRGSDGQPLKYGEPTMERPEWDEIQALLNRPKQVYRRAVTSPLTRVVFCNECGRPWYYRTPQGPEKTAHYYCSSKVRLVSKDRQDCAGGRWAAPELEKLVEDIYLARFGPQEIVIARAKPRVAYASMIGELDERIANLASSLGALKPGGVAHSAVVDQLNAAEAERGALEEASKAAQGVEYELTGRTYGQEWADAEPEDRLALLRRHNVSVMVQRGKNGLPTFFLLRMGDSDHLDRVSIQIDNP